MEGGFPVAWFVVKPAHNFICSICLDVLNDPYQYNHGHNHCLCCIERSMVNRNECPVCRREMIANQISENRFASETVNNALVKCNIDPFNVGDVCHWTGPLSGRDAHVAICSFQQPICCPIPIDCCSGNCTRRFESRVALSDHLRQYGQSSNSLIRKQEHTIDAFEVKENLGFSIIHKPIGPPANYVVLNRATGQMTQHKRRESVYCGEHANNIKCGLGVTKEAGGMSYVGSYFNNLRHGMGIYSRLGEIYNGMWVAGLRHGKCYFFARGDGTQGSGSFEKDLMCGQGNEWTDLDKSTYVGSFHNGKRHGVGTMVYECGTISFTGQFYHGSVHGEGVLTLPTLETITGVFHKESCLGIGILKNSKSEIIYKGQFNKHVMEGHGVLQQADGTVYTGSFFKGVKHGHGTIAYPDKSEFQGEYCNDLLHGEGVAIMPNGLRSEPLFYVNGVLREGNKMVFDVSGL